MGSLFLRQVSQRPCKRQDRCPLALSRFLLRTRGGCLQKPERCASGGSLFRPLDAVAAAAPAAKPGFSFASLFSASCCAILCSSVPCTLLEIQIASKSNLDFRLPGVVPGQTSGGWRPGRSKSFRWSYCIMNKETFTVRKLTRCAVVAAIYVALCLGWPPSPTGPSRSAWPRLCACCLSSALSTSWA